MKRLISAIGRLSRFSGSVGEGGLFALFLIVCWEVITRYFFKDPSIFSAEVSEYLMVLLTFSSAGIIMREGRHVRVEVLVSRLGKRRRAMAEVAIQAGVLLVCAILIKEGAKSTYIAFVSNYRSTSLLRFPLWIPYAFVPAGALVLGMQSLAIILDSIREIRK